MRTTKAILTLSLGVSSMLAFGCSRGQDSTTPSSDGQTILIGEDPAASGCSADSDCPPLQFCRGGICAAADVDNDGDGFFSATDCDDVNPNRYPAAPEVCNGIDDNCDGVVDEGLLNDCGTCGDAPREVCDGVDNDCDGVVDDDCAWEPLAETEPNAGQTHCTQVPVPRVVGEVLTVAGTFSPAADIDSFCFTVQAGYEATIRLRSAVLGAPTDAVLHLFNGAGEALPGGYNDYTNGPDPRLDYKFAIAGSVRLDVYEFNANAGGPDHIYELDIEAVAVPPCVDGDADGFAICEGDCADDDPTTYPGRAEVCDGEDNNCDGVVDEGCDAQIPDEVEPNSSVSSCTLLSPPFVIDGVIQSPGDADFFCFAAAAGASYSADVDAAETGSFLHSTLAVYALPQNQIAFNDVGVDPDTGYEGDSFLTVTMTKPGIYAVRVGDRSASAGGIGRRYRLHVRPTNSVVCRDEDGDGVSTCEGDCADDDATVYFGRPESCDGKDNNCDGVADPSGCIVDADGDGFSPESGDCNDNSAAISPLGVEVCDDIDNDCDGDVDEGLRNACGTCGAAPPERCADGIDNDCDGIIDDDCGDDLDGDGVTPDQGDCDDSLASVAPGAVEVCDGLDNDCDGQIDEFVKNGCGGCGPLDEICDGFDNDCDGQIDDGVLNACGTCGPTPEEVCDGIDNDCDGEVDEALLNRCGLCGELPVEVCDLMDNDCDGLVDEGCDADLDLDGLTPREGDCDDADILTFSGAGEACDGVDNDCNGAIDDDEACPTPQESEGNDQRSACDELVFPGAIEGVISAPLDVDTFCLDVEAGTRLSLDIEARDHGSSLDSVLTVYDADGEQVAFNNDNVDPDTGALSKDSYANVTFEASGRYVVAVKAAAGGVTGGANAFYRLEVDVKGGCLDLDRDGISACDGDCDDRNAAIGPGTIDVCDGVDNNCNFVPDEQCVNGCLDDIYENNDTLGSASSVTNGLYSGLVYCPGDQDHYAIEAEVGDLIRCDALFSHAEVNLFLQLYGPDGLTVLSQSATASDNESVTAVATESGRHFCRVYGGLTESGPYELLVSVTKP